MYMYERMAMEVVERLDGLVVMKFAVKLVCTELRV